MEEHNINPTILHNFESNCESMEMKRANGQGVLKGGVENANLQFMSIHSRDQEYIDHTLLGPEYIGSTISNSFIIDLMEDQHDQAASDCPITALGSKESFGSEAQLHSILQFVNRQGHIRNPPNINIIESSNDHLIHYTDKEIIESDILSLQGNLLNDQNFKLFCTQQIIPNQEVLSADLNVVPLPSMPAPSALSSTQNRWHKKHVHEPLEEMPELIGPLVTTPTKVLPHKKRISKTLKDLDRDENIFQLEPESPLRINRFVLPNISQFECELCGSISESQVQFFSHLKGHYEPSIVEETECTIDTMQNPTIVPLVEEPIIKESPTPSTVVVMQNNETFNEVELNFDNFNEVVHLTAQDHHQQHQQQQQQHVTDQAPDQNNIKILDSNTIISEYVVQVQEPTQVVCNVHEEVEFSDTEDMLEGIRSVVDKVSIDDTSNDLDMHPRDISKEPWFTNSAFNVIPFKEEILNSEEFERTTTELMPISEHVSDNHNTPIKSPNELQSEINEFERTTTELMPISENVSNNHNTAIINQNGLQSEVNFTQNALQSEVIDNPSVDTEGTQINESKTDSKSVKKKLNPKPRGRPKNPALRRPALPKPPKIDDDESSEEFDEEDNKRRYICPECNREFNSSNALKYHHLSHTGERPHQCEVCGKSFFAQGALKSHMRLHTGDKPYECEKCNRKFRQWSDLKYHNVSIHSDVKNYTCEFCGKSFSRKYSLVIHRRIHTSERNYQCEFCPKTFRASSYLQNHRKIHTGEKPYTCEACGKKFRVGGDLRRHSRTHERKASKKSTPPAEPKITIINNPIEISNDTKSDVDLKIEYEKESKDELLFLDKMASKIDHLFKTEEDFVNADMQI